MSVDVEATESRTEEYLQYRELNSSAVVSVLLGVLSLLTFLDWFWAAIPLVGIAVGVSAVRAIRRRPHEVAGMPLAFAGILLSAGFLVSGVGCLTYIRLTEVPDGHARVDYSQLQPAASEGPQGVPPSASALNGKKIFIKGYIYPGRSTDNIKHFLLVRDQGDCCFGGNPKITERIQVTTVDPLRISYAPRLHSVAGTFHVRSGKASDGPGGVLYQLDATQVR